jgi:nucleotide-binding universal stress UspA family protein
MATSQTVPFPAAPPLRAPEILLATDFGDLSTAALACAKQIARRHGATIRTLHVVDLTDARAVRHSSFSSAQDSAQRGLRRIQHDLRLAHLRGQSTIISAGSAPHAIHDAVSRYKSLLLVLGRSGESAMLTTSIGATVRSILRRAEYPVLVVGNGSGDPSSELGERVLFVTDNSAESRATATRTLLTGDDRLAQPLWVVLPPEARSGPSNPSGDTGLFDPVVAIPHEGAAEALCHEISACAPTLIVISLRARGYLDGLTPRSLLYTLIARAPCPVLTIRQ